MHKYTDTDMEVALVYTRIFRSTRALSVMLLLFLLKKFISCVTMFDDYSVDLLFYNNKLMTRTCINAY